MVGLLDIAPIKSKVKVGAHAIEVGGISAAGIAYLLKRFPELKELMAGGENVSADALAAKVPDAIAAIIACGTGNVSDEEAEAVAASLALDTQLDFLAEILALTMPKGAGPFFEKLQRTMGALDVSAKTQGMPSQPASST